ncbi:MULTISPECIES: hypothetical protein [unclassified Streptomyces]|nr:hypothetical protein OG457_43380 [Streptomyces sp. NBC_01207]WTA23185.1 hypothetical protein OG365_37060 [Streptomyces sp. NBC_00853]
MSKRRVPVRGRRPPRHAPDVPEEGGPCPDLEPHQHPHPHLYLDPRPAR